MIANERGGIISKIFVIPVGVALMVGFFFLGYYVGKYQSKTGAQNSIIPPLPEIVSNPPKREEFTFYKTLSDKENKTVSIDLKPRSSTVDDSVEKKPAADAEQAKDKGAQSKKDRKTENKAEKTQTAAAKEPVQKAETAQKDMKLRYTLQIASYQEKAMAEEDVKKMKQRGYAAFIVASDLEGKGTWYRVRLGSFTNKASAEKLQKELRAKAGISPFITLE